MLGLRAGWIALFVFVWIIGAFFGSTFEYQNSVNGAGIAYSTGVATFTNGSTSVTGAGTAWGATMENGNIKADADAIWTKIKTVTGAGSLTLYSPYSGTGGAGLPYTMAVSPGWAGSGTGGYSQAPTNTLSYLFNVSNAFQKIPLLGNIPLPVPNASYFQSVFRVMTWQWSFMDGYSMIYWIFFAPFVAMGVLSMLVLFFGLLRGNITF